MDFDSKFFDLERSLQQIRESRMYLEGKTQHQMNISNELVEQNKNSMRRLINNLEFQNQQAKERNIEFINDVLNDVAKLNIEKLNPKIKHSEIVLNEAKKNYFKKLDGNFTLLRRSQSLKLESKINQVKSEKILLHHRRENALKDYINEERLHNLLEKERRDLIYLSSLENEDLMKYNHSKYLLSQQAKIADNQTIDHLIKIASSLDHSQNFKDNSLLHSEINDSKSNLLLSKSSFSYPTPKSENKISNSLPISQQIEAFELLQSENKPDIPLPRKDEFSHDLFPNNNIDEPYVPENLIPSNVIYSAPSNLADTSTYSVPTDFQDSQTIITDEPKNEIVTTNVKEINLEEYFKLFSKFSWDFLFSLSKICFERLPSAISLVTKLEEFYVKDFLYLNDSSLSILRSEILTLIEDFDASNSLDDRFQSPKYLTCFLLSVCTLKSEIILPKDIFAGVVTLDKLKKELKRLPKSLIFWDSLIAHLKSVIEKFPNSSNFLSELFTSSFVKLFIGEEKDRIQRKLSKLLQLSILPDSNSPKKEFNSYKISTEFISNPKQNKSLVEFEDEFMEEATITELPKMKVIQTIENKYKDDPLSKESILTPRADRSEDEFDF